jgi:hypothetical protein
MLSYNSLIVVVAVSLAVTPCVACAQTGDAKSPDLSFVLDGIKAERQRLRSGVYRIVGSYAEEVTHGRESDAQRSGKVDAFCAFDHLNGFVRFDRTVPSWLMPERKLLSAARAANVAVAPAELTFIYCKTPGHSAHYFSLAKRLELWATDTISPSSMPLAGGWMDIRALGFYNLDQVFTGLSFDDVLTKRFVKRKPDLSQEPNGQFLLTWILDDIERWQCWIDPKKGFSPIRFTGQFKLPELHETEWRNPHLEREIEWEFISNVWVPRTYRDKYVKEFPPKNPPKPPEFKYDPRYLVMRYVWNITWQSINEPVDKKYFDYEQLDLPDGTKVVDWRSKQPVFLHTIGAPKRRMDLAAVAKDRSWSTTRIAIIAVNALLVFVLAILYIVRRLRRQNSA